MRVVDVDVAGCLDQVCIMACPCTGYSRESISTKARPSAPGRGFTRWQQARQKLGKHGVELASMAKDELTQQCPTVDGAYTWATKDLMRPARTRSTSSM